MPEYQMASVTFAQALTKYRIAIAPMVRRRGDPSWFAGQRTLNGDGITNVIDPLRKVEGRASPENALRDLLVILGSEDVLVGDEEVSHVLPEEPEPEAVQIESSPIESPPIGSIEDDIVVENGKFTLKMPDGKTYQASRKRDLLRRIRQVA